MIKPEIRKNKYDYDHTVKEKIHLRILRLNRNCVGFKKEIDIKDENYKKIMRLFDSRNDMLHGNVDPLKLKVEKVYFDQKFIPIFDKAGDIFEKIFNTQLMHLDEKTIKETIETVGSFIFWICSHLEKPYRDEFEMMLGRSSLGWRQDKQRLGILFPEHSVDISMPGPNIYYDVDLS